MHAYKNETPWRRSTLTTSAILLTMLIDVIRSNEEKSPKTCYFPSGGIAFGGACNPDAEVSACCPFGWSCLSNGLCKTNPGNERNFKYRYYRSSCTDHVWHSPLCNHSCRDAEDNTDAGHGLQLCDEEKGTYCCARDYNCCLDNSTSLLVLGAPNATRTLIRPTELPESMKRRDIAKDTIIGIAVGFSIAAVVFLSVWIFWVWRRRRLERKRLPAKARGDAAELDATETTSAMNMVPKNETEVTQVEVVELESPNSTARSELDGTMMSPSRSGTWGSLSSPATDMASLGILVTDDIVELDAATATPWRCKGGAEKGSAESQVSAPSPTRRPPR